MEGIKPRSEENVIPIQESTYFELTSEQLEVVMSKVVDINKEGTAYTDITMEMSLGGISAEKRFESVFDKGLLNPNWLSDELSKDKNDAILNVSDFANKEMERKRGLIYFNIVGRTSFPNREVLIDEEIATAFLNENEDNARIGIIFDLASYYPMYKDVYLAFKEYAKGDHVSYGEFQNSDEYKKILPKLHPKFKEFQQGKITHRIIAQNSSEPNVLDKEGFPKADVDYGHVVSNRVAPRFFKGVIVAYKVESKKEILVSHIVETMLKKGKELLPVYDEYGNLLWPKKISHEEIVKMKEKSE